MSKNSLVTNAVGNTSVFRNALFFFATALSIAKTMSYFTASMREAIINTGNGNGITSY